MVKKTNNLTIVIVTYLTKRDILLNCLESIDKNFKVLIVENSKKFPNKNFFLKKFSNLEIICSGTNLGYGKGNNFGLVRTKTDFALILNPDTILENNFFVNVKKIIKSENFSIIGCQYKNDKIFMPAGYFDAKKNKKFRENFFIKKTKKLIKVDWVVGCAMLLNLDKFKNRKLFDENFFLYFEESDFCLRASKENKNYQINDIQLSHNVGTSVTTQNENEKNELKKLYTWHFIWSKFYYYKKNYSYIGALLYFMPIIIRIIFKIELNRILGNSIKKEHYEIRLNGLNRSIRGLSSNKRIIK